ncbi:surface carbohydrate biosynthesis protein [Rhodovulum sp. ES.010]|uniref:surface carbohydrate biosynthesis protein n=1 Tax=Rhodovulum sp. ES.010 TaxID=1882821 RepID=UPI0009275155|nr:surface carbohydrate biosynthesis protein [Rhodovulum sp. ES.010]SIO03428.1 surface carbohydrate biosynthesis protein [Rhodovulum sp. ES.010]
MTSACAGRGRGWLHVYIETKPRELDARLFLACCAAERGFEVLLGRQNALRRRAHRLPRAIVFEKSIDHVKTPKLERLHRLGHVLVVSDEESQSVYTRPGRFLATRLDDRTLAMTEAYYVWGEQQREILAGGFPASAAKFRVTGSPRIDLWRPPLNAIHEDAAADLRRRFGRFILLPSNFAIAIHARGRDFPLDQAEKNGNLRTEAEREWFMGAIAHGETALAAFVDAIDAIRARFPDHAVVVRPHPSDDQGAWRTALAGRPGCHVVYEGPVGPWLMAADAMFHHGCTTAIESFFMGRPTVSYLPGRDPRYEDPVLNTTGPVAEDVAALLDLLARALAGALPRDPVTEAHLHGYFDWDETRASADRIVDDLERIAAARGLCAAPGPVRPDHPVIGPLRRLLGRDRLRPSDPKWPGGLTDAEIDDRLALFRGRLDRFHRVAARRLTGDGVFHITARG